MKICIIAFTRSRSSMFLDTVSSHCNIPILSHEMSNIRDTAKISDYFSEIRPYLSKIENSKDCAVRIHPRQLVWKHFEESDFNHFNFSQYDKIYFTQRDSITDYIASNFVAEKLQRYVYMSSEEIPKRVGPFEFTVDDDYNVWEYINSEHLVNELKQYFVKHNISWEVINYSNVPDFLKEHYPNGKTQQVRTEYDYKTIVSNYNDILPVYNLLKVNGPQYQRWC